jgi:hypothetical protein
MANDHVADCFEEIVASYRHVECRLLSSGLAHQFRRGAGAFLSFVDCCRAIA